jgi:hypothetical protein
VAAVLLCGFVAIVDNNGHENSTPTGANVLLAAETTIPAIMLGPTSEPQTITLVSTSHSKTTEETEEPTARLAPEVLPVECPMEITIKDYSSRNWTPLGNRAETAWTMFGFLHDYGWSYNHIVAVIGNFMTECSLWYSPDYNAYYKGICQWEPVRWDKLVNQGFAMSTLKGQLAAMLWEFENDYSRIYTKFMAAESVGDSLRVFTDGYEVGAHYNVRLFYAEQFADIFADYNT